MYFQLFFWAIRTRGLRLADMLGGPQAASLGATMESGKKQGYLVISRDQSEEPSSVWKQKLPPQRSQII